MLNRAMGILQKNHPTLFQSREVRTKFVLPPPDIKKEGKLTVILNFEKICTLFVLL
jgi:translation initiation factor 2 beta subunit (eIF-2beta)/eIF-5